MVFINFGCSFSFGKSFLTCPLQAITKISIASKVKTCICEQFFFIVQIVLEVLLPDWRFAFTVDHRFLKATLTL
jgi:hypothetical protein